MLLKRWAVLFLILAFASPVFAGGATVSGAVTKHDGSAVAQSNFVACYDNSVSLMPSGAVGALTSTTFTNPLVLGADGSFNFWDGRSSLTVGMLAVEGVDIASVITAKGYYGFGSYSLGAVTSTPTTPTVNIKCNYKADSPYAPSITKFEEVSATDPVKNTKTSSLKVTANEGSGSTGDREIKSHGWKYWIPADPANAMASAPPTEVAGATSTVLDLDSTKVTPGKQYAFICKTINQWGETWSSPQLYTIGSGGTGGVATSFTYDLLKSEAGKVVINAISSPKDIQAFELAKLINAAKSGDPAKPANVVIAIGHWTGAASEAFIVDDKSGASKGFTIRAGEGVQVYVNDDVKGFKLSN
ncbi:hypothetical protein HZC34_06145 [Candidatus Saganbacteria bacterium]|nr:hypothetical protein [Candidatus Saganbacteria bacterium]